MLQRKAHRAQRTEPYLKKKKKKKAQTQITTIISLDTNHKTQITNEPKREKMYPLTCANIRFHYENTPIQIY